MKDKVCIVTGSSSGIGYDVALQLAKNGAIPVLLSRNNQRGKETFDRLCKINGRTDWIPTDLSSRSSIRKSAEEINSRYGRCDVLFNCAGN